MTLETYSFSLNESGVDVLRVDEAVLHNGGVFRTCSDEPNWAVGAFGDNSTTGVNVNLPFSTIFQVVIGCPD